MQADFYTCATQEVASDPSGQGKIPCCVDKPSVHLINFFPLIFHAYRERKDVMAWRKSH